MKIKWGKIIKDVWLWVALCILIGVTIIIASKSEAGLDLYNDMYKSLFRNNYTSFSPTTTTTTGHYLLIDNAGHYLLIDNAGHKLRIDGSE